MIPTPLANIFASTETIANKFGLSYKQLSQLIYPDTAKCYRNFLIPKKSGGFRTISAPRKALKSIQRIFAAELEAIYTPKSSSHGFIKGRSIVTNASRHTQKSFVFNIDLKDFFGSIHFGRIRNLLMSAPFNYSYPSATILAQLCCHKGVLPQGAPTSPILSNMICRKLDAQLQSLASKSNCDYSRYADDITFSFSVSRKHLPKEIVHFDDLGKAQPGDTISRLIEESGFTINFEKVRLQPQSQRQEVTGLVVNEFTNVSRDFVRKTSSMLNAWERYGAVNAERDYFDKYNPDLKPNSLKYSHKKNGEYFKSVVIGRINYIQMVKGRHNAIYRSLAFQLTKVLGKPNPSFLQKLEDQYSDSIFVVDNNIGPAQGTAFLLDKIGLVTNEHVATGIDETNFECIDFFHPATPNEKITSHYLLSNKQLDIAIFLHCNKLQSTPSLTIGDDSKLHVGDQVFIMGYPSYGPGDSVYKNELKIVQRTQIFGQTVWLVDTPIVHGSSGAPIFNKSWQVIGIATYGTKDLIDDTKYHGFIPISTLTKHIKKTNFWKKTTIANVLDLNLLADEKNPCFLYHETPYCTACFTQRKLMSQLQPTKDSGKYNCKYCAKTLAF